MIALLAIKKKLLTAFPGLLLLAHPMHVRLCASSPSGETCAEI
jgi:hypothetical protein